MKDITFIISATIIFLLGTVLMPILDPTEMGYSFNWIYMLFIIGNGALVFMIYKILKSGKPSPKKFDEGNWYEDGVK